MTPNRRYTLPLAAALLGAALTLLPRGAQADARGEKVMKLMDRALTVAKDQILEMEMVVEDPGKQPRRLGMIVHVRGTAKRRVHFVSPGDVKGLKLLTISREQMYTYLPAYRKVRRIASHVRAQTSFGADFNYDDMATVVYGPIYQPRFVSETKTHWTIDGTRRPKAASPYARLRVRVRKDLQLPDRIWFFNAKGAKIKTEVRSDYSCEQHGKTKVCGAGLMHMVSHTRNEHWTKIVRNSWKINTDFSEKIFSLRRLQRGR